MIPSIMNKNHTRLPLLLGVACVTMLALLMSTLAIFTPIASVHAMGLPSADPTLCVSVPTMAHCTHQDPLAQGCSSDAQTLAYEDFIDPSTGNSLARAERRYSPKCHTYWGRIVEPVTGKRGLSLVIALNGGPPQVSTTTGTEVFTGGGPITMDEEDVCHVCRSIPEAKIVAVHMETVNHCRLTRAALREKVEVEGLQMQVSLPHDGERLTFSIQNV